METGQTITITPNPLTSQQNTGPSPTESYIQPGLAKLKLCPFDAKVSIVSFSHKYEHANPQSFIIHAKRGDKVNITLRVTLNPNLLKCIRDTLKLAPGDQLNIGYGLRLGSGEGIAIQGAKRMNLSKVELRGEREGPYNLIIVIDDNVEPGNYYTVLYAWIKITGKAEIKSETEYTILLNIE